MGRCIDNILCLFLLKTSHRKTSLYFATFQELLDEGQIKSKNNFLRSILHFLIYIFSVYVYYSFLVLFTTVLQNAFKAFDTDNHVLTEDIGTILEMLGKKYNLTVRILIFIDKCWYTSTYRLIPSLNFKTRS